MCMSDFETVLIVALMIGNVVMLGFLILAYKAYRDDKARYWRSKMRTEIYKSKNENHDGIN